MEKYDENSVELIIKAAESLTRDEVQLELKTKQYNSLTESYPPKDNEAQNIKYMLAEDKKRFCIGSIEEKELAEYQNTHQNTQLPSYIEQMITRISDKRKTLCSLITLYDNLLEKGQ